eukprot:349907-Chlamydomonas_euryale.AAC.7
MAPCPRTKRRQLPGCPTPSATEDGRPSVPLLGMTAASRGVVKLGRERRRHRVQRVFYLAPAAHNPDERVCLVGWQLRPGILVLPVIQQHLHSV